MSKINLSTSSKLKGIPKIICRNQKDHVEERDRIENLFKSWSIDDYQIHTNKYGEDNYSEWKDLVIDQDLVRTRDENAYTLNVIDAIVEWYDSESSDVCIFADDCLDFSSVEQWGFDWEFLEYHLPYNWDCIQLYTSSRSTIKMHLHPWTSANTSHQCFMITRTFAKRLKKFHFLNGKYKLAYQSPDKNILFTDYGSLDSFFFDLGLTYTLPIFGLNTTDHSDVRDSISSDAIKYWWKYKSPNFSNFEFFHYNKGDKEWKMEVLFDSSGVYMDDEERIMLWI